MINNLLILKINIKYLLINIQKKNGLYHPEHLLTLIFLNNDKNILKKTISYIFRHIDHRPLSTILRFPGVNNFFFSFYKKDDCVLKILDN